MAHVRQKDEGGVRKKNNDKPRGVKADKQVTTAAVAQLCAVCLGDVDIT